VEAEEPQHLRVGEAEVGQTMEGFSAEGEQHVARIDRLRNAVEGPEGGAMAPLPVAVLDVVVDQAEVMAEFHRRRARQRVLVIARDRGVGQQTQQRPHPFPARAAAVQAEVVAAHGVQTGRGRVAI
jgi:hypothetical protein